jgi:hypothetical protein
MRGRALAPGTATGPATVLVEPLSLWGGFDPGTGALIEARHPQHGAVLAGRVLVMPAARGSSSSSSVLAEAVRAGAAPAAILLGEPDHILAIGAAVAEELYSVQVPILILDPADLASIREGAIVNVEGERVIIG